MCTTRVDEVNGWGWEKEGCSDVVVVTVMLVVTMVRYNMPTVPSAGPKGQPQ